LTPFLLNFSQYSIKGTQFEVTNKVALTINSEPQGARIYSGGSYRGVTPLKLTYDLEERHYQYGELQCAELVAISDGFLPAKQGLKLKLDPNWKYWSGYTYDYSTLFILERDPYYSSRSSSGGDYNVNVNVRQQKDDLDILQQIGEIGIIWRDLLPKR